MPELQQILDSKRKSQWEQNKFLAAIKGIKIDDYDTATDGEKTADDIRREAEAQIRGISEEQLAFEEVGIMIIDEQEE